MKGASIEVAIHTETPMVDLVVGTLSGLGFDGFWEDSGLLRCYVAASRWNPRLQEDVQRALRSLFGDRPLPRVSITTIDPRNWNGEWEKSIQPIRVSDRVVIRPSWHPYDAAPGEIVITIDPKMSFGTGYHESTRIIVRMMERHVRPNDHVLDCGTGTGILAIAAIALGAGSVVGVDTDEWSYDNAMENVLGNKAENITILHGSIEAVPDDSFDLILANIQRNVIVSLLPGITSHLRHGGVALFSGLLAADGQEVARELTDSGFTVLETAAENGWIGIAAGYRSSGQR
jgi:ribosomal protein L11 methyltransferase